MEAKRGVWGVIPQPRREIMNWCGHNVEDVRIRLEKHKGISEAQPYCVRCGESVGESAILIDLVTLAAKRAAEEEE